MALGWLHLARCAGMCLCWGRGRGAGAGWGQWGHRGDGGGLGAPCSRDAVWDWDIKVLVLLHSNTGAGGRVKGERACRDTLECSVVCSSHTLMHMLTHTPGLEYLHTTVRGVHRLTPYQISQHPSGTLPVSGPSTLLTLLTEWASGNPEQFHHVSMSWVWGSPQDQKSVPHDSFGVPEQDRRQVGGEEEEAMSWVQGAPRGGKPAPQEGSVCWSRMEEEEEAGKGCRRRRRLGGAAGVPEPDTGTDMLAWQGWGRTHTPASTKPSPLPPVERYPQTSFP